ncbi:MAG: hypothetical protein AAF125_01350 [Chloroflexota bacterium]
MLDPISSPDDPRAQFVLAQYLIEQGRTLEALALLRELESHFPQVADWIERLENGETVDPDELRWEPDMIRPMPQRPPMPQWNPGRALVAMLMALSLFLPLLQMLTFARGTGTPQPDGRAAIRSEARVRAQMLCEAWIAEAIGDGLLDSPVGSCMEWSLGMPSGQMRDTVRCHERNDPPLAFRRCMYDAGVTPPGVPIPTTY